MRKTRLLCFVDGSYAGVVVMVSTEWPLKKSKMKYGKWERREEKRREGGLIRFF